MYVKILGKRQSLAKYLMMVIIGNSAFKTVLVFLLCSGLPFSGFCYFLVGVRISEPWNVTLIFYQIHECFPGLDPSPSGEKY